MAKLSEGKKSWIVSSVKNKILNRKYDHYLLFARTKHYPEDEFAKYKTTEAVHQYEELYDGVVRFLIEKDQLQISRHEMNNLNDPEFNYQPLKLMYVHVLHENKLFGVELSRHSLYYLPLAGRPEESTKTETDRSLILMI